MQADFHYYATYIAAYIAGYSHEESLEICYSAQLVDACTVTFLMGIGAPLIAATTQLQLELADASTDVLGLQDITRIWSSFHFLPRDLYAEVDGNRFYRNKYRLICGPNGDLVVDTVNLAKGKSLQAVGIAMHVLADTWAHRTFAGTPSLVINNVGFQFREVLDGPDGTIERPVKFTHNATQPDNLEDGIYVNSLFQSNENSVMNLGHGRAGHLPDYSFMRYRYLPSWGKYEEVFKDNPTEYYHAFCQMVYAMQYLRGVRPTFEKDQYAFEAVEPWRQEIQAILNKRQLNACEDWKLLGETITGYIPPEFDNETYRMEYRGTREAHKSETFLGKFVDAAMRQKAMVTNRIYVSGNRLAGISITEDNNILTKVRRFVRNATAHERG